MTKAIFVIAVLALLIVAGCAPAAPTAEKEAATVKTDAAVAEASQDFVEDSDTVEIGEMI